jgi:PTH1 family peptidyl-tRNA hydrolase
VKVVCGLGNPGPEYEATRHNIGWWVLCEAREAWGFPPFRRAAAAAVSEGRLATSPVRLLLPLTYMNRSGGALAPLAGLPDFDIATDLLVVVDDVALDVGRVRFRPGGSSGGHNGLKSIEAALRTRDYPRMRIGVGAPPPDGDLADWVLSEFEPEDAQVVEDMLPALADALRTWVEEGTEEAARRCNR